MDASRDENSEFENDRISSSSESASGDSEEGEMGQLSSLYTTTRGSNVYRNDDLSMDAGSEENFDMSLPASHSYLPGGLVAVQGRTVVEPGWEGKMPCWQHHSVIFPGECLPMVCTRPQDCLAMREVIQTDKLFGLLCPDDADMSRSYGVLCEVYEATEPVASIAPFSSMSFKARAQQRFQLLDRVLPRPSLRLSFCHIRILPDVVLCDPLLPAGLPSLEQSRNKDNYKSHTHIRRLDAASTTWPLSVYETLNVHKMTKLIKEHFKQLGFDSLPEDVVSLSFWVASNLSLTFSEKFLLFTIDNAVLRLFLEMQHIIKFQENSFLCCATCMSEVTNRRNIFAMSNEGLRSNYCNPGGYVHDTLTVSKVTNVVLQGHSSDEFSWFPGYKWTIAQCGNCGSHLGWRFDALRRNLRPSSFWGLSQHYLSPRGPSSDPVVFN